MESKILLIDSKLRQTVEEFLRSAYEDLAEVKGVDEKSVGKVKRAKEDLADAIKLISVVPWKDNQTMWEEDKKKEDYQRDKKTEEALKLGKCGVWRIVDGELILEG